MTPNRTSCKTRDKRCVRTLEGATQHEQPSHCCVSLGVCPAQELCHWRSATWQEAASMQAHPCCGGKACLHRLGGSGGRPDKRINTD
jgi:hypothetical protein